MGLFPKPLPISDDEGVGCGVLIVSVIVVIVSAIVLPDYVNYVIVLPAIGSSVLGFIVHEEYRSCCISHPDKWWATLTVSDALAYLKKKLRPKS